MSGSSSPLSSLSSAPPTDDEMPSFMLNDQPVDAPSPSDAMSSPAVEQSIPKRKRAPSPPHEEVLADNQDIAFIVMFRSRFSDAFPTKLIQFGPQDIERGVVDTLPSPQVESLLCALLGLVLNRKKPVERGHHGRALEEALSANKTQWPRDWNGVNPLSGGRSFNTMSPQERLTLMKSLIMWSLHNSEAVNNVIKESYKQSRHDDDLNQPLSVQPWGRDGEKRRYWLVEGRDDTPFRLYRESNPLLKKNTWWSVAGTIDELRGIAEKLNDDNSQAARRLSQRIMNSIPRFEATEEKRKRREYRQSRKAQFSNRPLPGMEGMYEGRTRGKRMRYTFSEEDDDGSESAGTNRRSTRNSGVVTPDPSRPTVTASGRQVRTRVGGLYGESLLSGPASTGGASPATEDYEHSDGGATGRPTRSSRRGGSDGQSKPGKHIEGYNSLDELDDEDEAISSGHDWDAGDEDDVDDNLVDDEDEDMSEESEDDDLEPKSLVVTLRYRKGAVPQQSSSIPVNAAPGDTSLMSMPVAEGSDVKPKVSAPPAATTPSVPNGLPTQSTSIEAPNGNSALAPSQPAPALGETQQASLKHASDQSLAAPPGILAVHPAAAAPVPAYLSTSVQPQATVPHPQIPAHVETPVHKPQPQVSSVSGAYT